MKGYGRVPGAIQIAASSALARQPYNKGFAARD
jgi:hypothetical protein